MARPACYHTKAITRWVRQTRRRTDGVLLAPSRWRRASAADSGFFSYDMIGPSPPATTRSVLSKQPPSEIGRPRTPAAATGRRGDNLRGDDGEATGLDGTRRASVTGATTASSQTTSAADAYHRNHATVQLDIRDLKEGSGLSRCPSGRSSPTAPGSPAACSRTTSPAGPPASAAQPTTQLTVAATMGSSPHRAASSTTQAATDCACRSTGRANTFTTALSSATCPSSSDPRTARRAAHRTPRATNPQAAGPVDAPKRARPHTPTCSWPPGPNRRCHKPIGQASGRRLWK